MTYLDICEGFIVTFSQLCLQQQPVMICLALLGLSFQFLPNDVLRHMPGIDCHCYAHHREYLEFYHDICESCIVWSESIIEPT